MSHLNVFKQPKQFYLIFSVEFWERFGFYGMQAILAVYLVRILGMSESQSFILFGSFSALIFGSVAIGGFIGDKILGTKRTLILGAVILTVGYTLLGLSASAQHLGSSNLIYIAMGFITMGNGLFKANPSSLLAKLYEKGDKRLDGAFTMYYMAINLGSFFSMLLTPLIASKFGYGLAFSVSAIGLIITVINFLTCLNMVKGVGSKPDQQPLKKSYYLGVVVGTIALSFLCSLLLQHLFYAHAILLVVGITVVAIYMREAFRTHGLERAKMLVAFVLMLQAIAFFVLYFQMPTSLNFFAIKNVEHSLFGIIVAPEQFQALNPFWIVIASPFLAIAYNHLGERFAMPYKFAFGIALCALSFLTLKFGTNFANSNAIINANWLVLCYAFQSVGELLVSGLGLAMIAQLVPQRMMGFAMGMWFLTSATAAVIAGWVASLTTTPAGSIDAHESLAIYSEVFGNIGYVTSVIAIITFILAPKLTQIISGKPKVLST
ncbi:peptide ABC transporter permease [Psychromonas sp. PRT-SC03]|nr:peptide ABC transporter permease [Psychromonas sp. PRT-SC03]